ncbi:MAG: regulator of protease activity HflC (stomatin/prohibitin superfamily) [Bradymonadia bacterium]|jgi:regulator of protease activity HflC (stomatin/prohibitin superfamily)
MTACVPAGHVGVVMAFGEVKEVTLTEGLRFKAPHLTVMPVSVQARSYSVGFSANDANAAVSSDMQTVGFQVNIGWYVNPEQAWELVRYVSQNEDSWVPNVIDPAMRQGVKAVFSRYTLRQIIQEREQVRIEIGDEIQGLIVERLDERNEGLGSAVQISQVTLDNIDYSDDFEAVIEATQREEQRARLAENELRRIEIESQQQVVQAQAARQAAVERARGEAEAMLIRNEAQVLSFVALNQAGFDVNSYKFLEEWDGVLPTVMSGGAGLEMMFQRSADGSVNTEDIGLILQSLQAAHQRISGESGTTPPAVTRPDGGEVDDVGNE